MVAKNIVQKLIEKKLSNARAFCVHQRDAKALCVHRQLRHLSMWKPETK